MVAEVGNHAAFIQNTPSILCLEAALDTLAYRVMIRVILLMIRAQNLTLEKIKHFGDG